MDPAVNEECSRLDLVFAGDPASISVDRDQIVGCQLAPVQALRIDQELAGPARHRERKMVADTFAEPEMRSGAQGAGEILFCFRKWSRGGHALMFAQVRG